MGVKRLLGASEPSITTDNHGATRSPTVNRSLIPGNRMSSAASTSPSVAPSASADSQPLVIALNAVGMKTIVMLGSASYRLRACWARTSRTAALIARRMNVAENCLVCWRAFCAARHPSRWIFRVLLLVRFIALNPRNLCHPRTSFSDPLWRIAFDTLCGDMGSSDMRTPTARWIAAASAAGGGQIGTSPTPRTP